jgi:general secretion pathway protein C
LGLIALAAYFQASGLAALAHGWLSDQTDLLSYPNRDPPKIPLYPTHTTSAEPLIERNPFHFPAEKTSPEAGSALDCGLSATLVASFPGSTSWSLAALAVKPGERPEIVHVGERFQGRVVLLVHWNRVVLGSGDESCQVVMFRSHTSIKTEGLVAQKTPRTSDGVLDGIEQVSADEVRVRRSTIDRVLASPFDYVKNIRIVPEIVGGSVAGIRLLGIGPGSLLAAVGLQNGDRLESINGFEVGTPEQMVTAYASLRTSPNLSLRVTRAGQTRTLDITTDVR